MWAESSDLLQGYYAYYCTEVGAGRRAVFEVQFHTPASYALEEEQIDALIGAMREEPSVAERAKLCQKAVKMWRRLPTPPGAAAVADEPPTVVPDPTGEGKRVALLQGH